MAICIACGRRGFFFKVNRKGICAKCVIRIGQEQEDKLLEYIELIETESKALEWGVATWPYEQLADMYRNKKDSHKEVAVLERFAVQKHAPGPKAAELLERLKEK